MNTQTTSFEYPIQIKEFHLDTFGHVNNATYLQIFEEARWEFISGRGYSLEKIKSTNLGPIILEINLKFMKEVKNREQVTVKSRCLSYKDKIGQLEQVIINSKGEATTIATMVFGLFDTANRKLVLPTDDWLKAVGMR